MSYALVDAYGRPLKDLRLSVTPECNLDCFFCHMEGLTSSGPVRPGAYARMGGELLSVDDYYVLSAAASQLGVETYKLTGGEPLVREDVEEIVRVLSERSYEVSMTTNGTLLPLKARGLAESGLSRVNVSIHGMDLKVYRAIMGRPLLDLALKGVDAALEAGLGVKINFVLVKGVNEGHFWRLLGYAESRGVDVQVIELHPAGRGAKVAGSYRRPLDHIKPKLEAQAVREEKGRLHNRTVYVMPSGIKVYLVDPVYNPRFCEGCFRLRISWDGSILPCLYWKGPRPSILPALRSQASFEEKVEMVKEVLVKANWLRRPSAFYGPGRERPLAASRPGGGLRIRHPSKSSSLRLLSNLDTKGRSVEASAGG